MASRGFTLVELMAVLAIISILLGIAVPTYMNSIVRGKEAVLKEDLYQMRDAIDKYYADNGEYPPSLYELVDRKYLRAVPIDPFMESAGMWVEELSEDGAGVYDVRSGSDGVGRGGTPYNEW